MKSNPPTLTRREALLSLGALAALAATTGASTVARGEPPDGSALGEPKRPLWRKPPRPVTAVIVGAGSRGRTYAAYAETHPEELKIVGVAEPIASRNEFLAKRHSIPADRRWDTWERIFEQPKFCDAAIITTPDRLHYGPAMAALDSAYDLLLEKAIAQSWKECEDILLRSKDRRAIVGICHVLRYSPYFQMMKHVIDSGHIGEVVSVQHLEPIGHIHMAHSFVRGNWRNEQESNPILLSKSCHDLDILRWMIGRPCRSVQSFGGLKLYRREMKPPGAPARCADGCPIERECPFSALEIYVRRKEWLHHKDTPGDDEASIREWLQRTNYGRCVYQLDNDVMDHQIVNMEFEGGVTAAFSMEALTSYGGRRTRVMGTKGDIVGDDSALEVCEFRGGKRHRWTTRDQSTIEGGHGGGDFGLMRDWVQAVAWKDATLLTSTIEASMESHLIGFAAEESRREGGTLKRVAFKGDTT